MKEEIILLKIFIIESLNDLSALREAEERVVPKVQDSRSPDEKSSLHLKPVEKLGKSRSRGEYGLVSRARAEAASPDTSPLSRSSSARSKSSTSTAAQSQSDTTDHEIIYIVPANSQTDGSSDSHRLSPYGLSKPQQTSNVLLEMAPLVPRSINRLQIGSGSIDGRQDRKVASQEATNSVRQVMDRWVTSGSKSVSDILAEETNEEEQEP